jgi:hypothetical protein
MYSSVRPLRLVALAAFLAAGGAGAGSALALDRDGKFFKQVEGTWVGPGEIVAGKYKGTKFTCNFTGATPGDAAGMHLDGACRVGVFTQKMSARVERKGRHYRGTFMDGSEGAGLDIVSGNVDGERVVFALNRKELNGAMLARLPDENTMNVTVSVRVNKQLVPVIGISLKRVDSETQTGSLSER